MKAHKGRHYYVLLYIDSDYQKAIWCVTHVGMATHDYKLINKNGWMNIERARKEAKKFAKELGQLAMYKERVF